MRKTGSPQWKKKSFEENRYPVLQDAFAAADALFSQTARCAQKDATHSKTQAYIHFIREEENHERMVAFA
jgi:hypothetical protein